MNQTSYHSDHSNVESAQLRDEIASAAARLIAEDGLDYGAAKRKAAKLILGGAKVSGNYLPDNQQVEDEVRLYNSLFFADTQPARLAHLRELACELMAQLAPYQPYLTGAVLNGTAGEHSDIHLHLFADSAKDVQIYLLNHNIDFTVSESSEYKGRDPIEIASFVWKNEGVHLTLFERDDVRGALKERRDGRAQRADLAALRALIEQDAADGACAG